jgi:hypothetical protein
MPLSSLSPDRIPPDKRHVAHRHWSPRGPSQGFSNQVFALFKILCG